MKYNRVSADCHLDLCCLPPEIFVSGASSTFKGRVPFVVDGPNGPYWTAKNGANFGLVNGVGPTGQPYVKGKQARVDRMAETGLYEDGRKGIRRVSDPDLRIKEMERDGVDAEVIYGILGTAERLQDPDASTEMMRVYNDWLIDFCSHYPDRHIGLACIPSGNIEDSAKEIRRVAKLGFRGVEIAITLDMMPTWHPVWEPIWQALNDVDIPVHFHAAPSVPFELFENQTGAVRSAGFFWSVTTFQANLFPVIVGIIVGSVLERYPNIRVAMGESGIGWLPYALDRLDAQWDERFKFHDMGLTMKPSDYWRRQCRATFQYEKVGTKFIDYIGADTLMWGSDFPHGDGVWPDSSEFIAKQFSHLSATDTRKITCDNAVKFYGLTN